MKENWRDPFGVTTIDRGVKIKVIIPEGYFFCEESDNNEILQKYLPCVAVLKKLVGDALYNMSLITEDGVITTTGYAANMIPSDAIIRIGLVDYDAIKEQAMKDFVNKPLEALWKINTKKNERTQKLRIYISGPISNFDPEERRNAFEETKRYLTSHGFDVFNPMENGLPAEATTNEHMKRDIEELLACDRIYMMKKWTHSKGCKVEFDVATAIGLPVMFEEYELNAFE